MRDGEGTVCAVTTKISRTVMAAVKARLELLGMTQAELAKHTGVSAAAVSRWLSGDRVPDLDDFAALADALRIAPEKLLKGRSR